MCANRKFKKGQQPQVGEFVSVPDRICFPGRRDPYEWENAIVLKSGVSQKTGEPAVRVKVWNHFTRTVYEKNYFVQAIEKYTHYERSKACVEFVEWAEKEKELIGV